MIANGIDAPALWPGLPVRPVKGEVLRLRWRSGCVPLPQRVIRARVHGRQVYIVPRCDGVVVGATQYEHGLDTAPTVTGVRELLDDACAVIPALGEYELAECSAGLRPMTPDNMPVVGRLDERTLVATGHGRSGFLARALDGRADSRRTSSCGGGGGAALKVIVNDQECEVSETTTVAELLESLGYPEQGIAVAVDWALLPRSQWDSVLSEGAHIEVVTAVQGG